MLRPASVTLGPGLTLTGFVDRVGDPVPMVAHDGSRHRPESLLTDALDDAARAAAAAPVSEVAVAVPAHWRPPMVDALRGALRSKKGLARSPLVSDAAAAVTALRSSPGLPSSGVIVLCDFGGSGSSITLIDAAADDAPIGETIRFHDFSGDRLDQAILARVVAGVLDASGADPAGTSMVGSLGRLRDECRRAKERLSDETATAIVVDVLGLETTVRMTRMELDALIDEPLDEFTVALFDTLERHRVPVASISAVATIGGGARIPLVTQRLSAHLRTAVVTTPQPQLTAADGAALIARRSRVVEAATTVAPAAPVAETVAAVAPVTALAWSEVEDEPRVEEGFPATPADSRPEVEFRRDQWDERQAQAQPRRRGPAVLFGVAAAAAVAAGVAFGLTALTNDADAVPAGTSSSIAPAPVADAAPPEAEVVVPAPAQAPVAATAAARPQPRVAARPPQQAPVQVPAPQHSAPPPAAPAAKTPAPAQAPAPEPPPEHPAPPTDPQPQTPPGDPQPKTPPIDPGTGTGTPPIDPGTGGGPKTPPADAGTGAGTHTGTGTGTPPIDPGTGAGSQTGTGTAAGGPAKLPLLHDVLTILQPQG
ncbi:hypothetical protein A5651_17700 [Mycobacterium sp. 1274761.0]|nr:hypothetical protein A5651_17700 [Mycobacterium sp. 1274761.0]